MTLRCHPKLINKPNSTEISDNIQAIGSILSTLMAATRRPASAKSKTGGRKDVDA